MSTPFALMLLARLDATPRLAEAPPQGGELSPRQEFMVMVGMGSGYMSALGNLEKDGYISTATRARLAQEQLAGMKGVKEDRVLSPSQVLPPRRK